MEASFKLLHVLVSWQLWLLEFHQKTLQSGKLILQVSPLPFHFFSILWKWLVEYVYLTFDFQVAYVFLALHHSSCHTSSGYDILC